MTIKYSKKGIEGQDKLEFYQFLDSMANATYGNFHEIKVFPSIEVGITNTVAINGLASFGAANAVFSFFVEIKYKSS